MATSPTGSNRGVRAHYHSISDIQGLEAELIAINGTGSVLVYRPGVGPNAVNVFDDINALEAAALALQGPKLIQWDATYAPIVIPAGSYTGIVSSATWTQAVNMAASATPIDVQDGVVFTGLPILRFGLNVLLHTTSTPVFTLAFGDSVVALLEYGGAYRVAADATIAPFSISGTFILAAFLLGFVESLNPAVPLIELTATAQLLVELGDLSQFGQNCVVGPVGSQLQLVLISNSPVYNAQPNFLGTFTQVLTAQAALTVYDDNLVPPQLAVDTDQEAIDAIKPAEREHAFGAAGAYSPASFVGMIFSNDYGYPLVITSVMLWNQVAGVSDDTIVDILVKDGVGPWTSIWDATPANRPTLNFAAGNEARVFGGAIDDATIPIGAQVRMDIDAAQGGAPMNLVVQVTYRRG